MTKPELKIGDILVHKAYEEAYVAKVIEYTGTEYIGQILIDEIDKEFSYVNRQFNITSSAWYVDNDFFKRRAFKKEINELLD
jgi:predicted nuclease of restriction endonuclease-like (RecB) superfamily